MGLGIYIQVPFCQTKCTYCNFHTGVVSTAKFQPYVDAVVTEIRNHRALYAAAGLPSAEMDFEAAAETIYIGGGTPSLLDPAELQKLLDAVRVTFALPWKEVTLEADPETIDLPKARAWTQAGINRVSLGVQSFSDRELTAAGRMHRREDILRAVPVLREAGIENFSFDLIAGLPHQTEESWKSSVEELLQLSPQHVSIYMLEVDEGSRLGKEILQGGARYGAAQVPSDDAIADFYEYACLALAAPGYRHYEISNWALPGRESGHNLKYWRRETYLGFGAGAHSFSNGVRWANAHDSASYVASIGRGTLPLEQKEVLTPRMALEEELFLGLRQLDGIDIAAIERSYGVDLTRRLETLRAGGLVEFQGSQVRLAPDRLSISNEVFVELMG